MDLAMAMMHAVYYRDPGGNEPVDDFIEQLQPEQARVAIDNQIDRLNMLRTNDPPLPFPHSSQIAGELRELRCHYGRRLIRVLYRRSDNLFILLHAFEKRSRQVSEQDKAVATQRWDDFRARMDAQPGHPPRAAGHDAP
jgi:phage-related protein